MVSFFFSQAHARASCYFNYYYTFRQLRLSFQMTAYYICFKSAIHLYITVSLKFDSVREREREREGGSGSRFVVPIAEWIYIRTVFGFLFDNRAWLYAHPPPTPPLSFSLVRRAFTSPRCLTTLLPALSFSLSLSCVCYIYV